MSADPATNAFLMGLFAAMVVGALLYLKNKVLGKK